MSHRIRVGVVRGGPSSEYEISLNTGAGVLSALRSHLADTHQARDIFIDRQGNWHIDGVLVEPATIPSKVDVVFNALHGQYGEDGEIQSLFETYGLPFTGSGSLGSAIGMNKILTKKILADHGIKVPFGMEVPSARVREDAGKAAQELFHSVLLPAVVKPAASGSSVGVTIVRAYGDLENALQAAARHSESVLIEEFIPGVEATCGVVECFRDQELYALPPIEIRPKTAFFDYTAKYAGQSEKIVPATFSQEIKKELEELARSVHRLLGLRHYSRSDFILHPRRGVYVLEVNTLPGFTEESLMPKALRSVGGNFHELVGHLIALALRRN